MATASLTTTPTVLDAGTGGSVSIKNTGTSYVTVVNGAQRDVIRPSRSYGVAIQGQVTVYVTADDGGTGAVTYEVSGARADVVSYDELSSALSGLSGVRATAARLLGRLRDPSADDPFLTVSADAPTITIGTSATITARQVGPQTGQVTEVGSRGTWSAANVRLPVTGLSGLDFFHTGTAVEIDFLSGTTTSALQCWVWVDGRPVTATVDKTTLGAVTSSIRYFVKLAFGSAKRRRIEFFSPHSGAWYGVRTAIGDPVEPAPRRPVVAFVSDSFWGGSSGSAGFEVAAFRIARMLGVECFNQSISGSGYAAGSSGIFGGSARVTAVSAGNPDLIVFQGSTNDDGQATTGADSLAAFAAYAAALPSTPCIVFGRPPNTGTGSLSANSAANITAVRASALASTNVIGFHDMIGMRASPTPTTYNGGIPYFQDDRATSAGSVWRWSNGGTAGSGSAIGTSTKWALQTYAYTGTGQVGTTTGDGSRDTLVYSDGVHPTVDGQDALASIQVSKILTTLASYVSAGTVTDA